MKKIIFILLISSQFLSAQNLNNLSFGTDTTFEVVSWNIEWFPKNGQTTANYVETILTNLEADVYALQEIDDTTLLKQVVANIPGYECYFKSTYYGGLGYVYNSNTVQINDKYEIFTAQPYWNAFPRSPQVLELTFMNKDYVIINNHFKCCGDGTLNINDPNDEENRRLQAIMLLEQYIDLLFDNERVILVGDLNDILTDPPADNIFYAILNSTSYMFTDWTIALGSNANWSYPSWPSHLDHILISDELIPDFLKPNSSTETIRIDDFMNSWNQYDFNISDHRPVGLKLAMDSVILSSVIDRNITNKTLIKITDLLGRVCKASNNQILFYLFDDGTVEKKLIIE